MKECFFRENKKQLKSNKKFENTRTKKIDAGILPVSNLENQGYKHIDFKPPFQKKGRNKLAKKYLKIIFKSSHLQETSYQKTCLDSTMSSIQEP